jgi:regulatory protein
LGQGEIELGFFPHPLLLQICKMGYPKTLTPDQALQKAKHYCSYQERCHTEVKEKLYGFGLRKNDVEPLLSQLIEEGYLNEERFAVQFAGGKFRIKGWGRNRITNELKQRQVSDYSIKTALKEVNEQDYQATLEKLARMKWENLEEENDSQAQYKKTQDYLLYKGYEWNLIQEVMKKIRDIKN